MRDFEQMLADGEITTDKDGPVLIIKRPVFDQYKKHQVDEEVTKVNIDHLDATIAAIQADLADAQAMKAHAIAIGVTPSPK